MQFKGAEVMRNISRLDPGLLNPPTVVFKLRKLTHT